MGRFSSFVLICVDKRQILLYNYLVSKTEKGEK